MDSRAPPLSLGTRLGICEWPPDTPGESVQLQAKPGPNQSSRATRSWPHPTCPGSRVSPALPPKGPSEATALVLVLALELRHLSCRGGCYSTVGVRI